MLQQLKTTLNLATKIHKFFKNRYDMLIEQEKEKDQALLQEIAKEEEEDAVELLPEAPKAAVEI